jgi:hypothetical protein
VCLDYQKELQKMQDIFSSKSIFFDYYLQYFTKPDPLWYGTLQKPAGYPALRAGIRDTDQH